MGKRIVVVNAGPRKGWNTDTLITEAAKGAEAAGATEEKGRHESIIRRDDGAPAIAASASRSNARITATRSSRVGAKPISFRNACIFSFIAAIFV